MAYNLLGTLNFPHYSRNIINIASPPMETPKMIIPIISSIAGISHVGNHGETYSVLVIYRMTADDVFAIARARVTSSQTMADDVRANARARVTHSMCQLYIHVYEQCQMMFAQSRVLE